MMREPTFSLEVYVKKASYLWQSRVCSAVEILRRSNNLTVLSVDPVATTHSLKGLKAKQLTWSKDKGGQPCLFVNNKSTKLH